MNNDNTQQGYIALFRSLAHHWLWQEKPFTRGQAWIDILLCANHSDVKVSIGNQVILCERGECIKSLDTWAERWGWDKSKVRRFLKMLETDTMIERKPTQKTTHLKVVNYDTYQTPRHKDETKVKRKRNDGETMATPNNNVNHNKPQQPQQTSDAVGDGDFLNLIPQEIKDRFSNHKSLIEYGEHCEWDVGKMRAYLDYADSQPRIDSPVGWAIKAAQDGAEIPVASGKTCSIIGCNHSMYKFSKNGQGNVFLCESHYADFLKVKQSDFNMTDFIYQANGCNTSPAIDYSQYSP